MQAVQCLVIFLLRHRLPRDYHFAAIQSERGKQLLQRAGLPHDNIRTIVLLRDGQHWLRAGHLSHYALAAVAVARLRRSALSAGRAH